jgi:hypothetical protein
MSAHYQLPRATRTLRAQRRRTESTPVGEIMGGLVIANDTPFFGNRLYASTPDLKETRRRSHSCANNILCVAPD